MTDMLVPVAPGPAFDTADPAPTLLPQRPRVVVVEDDDGLRELLSMTLERGGLDVVATSADGEAGYDAAVAHRPEVVLTDLLLPGIDGFMLAERLRRVFPDLVIAMLTGTPETDVPELAAAAGVDLLAFKHEGLARLSDRLAHEVAARRRPELDASLAAGLSPAFHLDASA